MQIEDVLERKGHQVYSVSPDCTVRELAAMIASRNIGAALVTDATGAMLGIVSERDIVRALGEFSGERLMELHVGGLMSCSVVTCTPQTSVSDALSLMASHRIRHLPVIGGNEILGLISIRDLLESRLEVLEVNFAALIRAKRESARAQQAAELSNRAKSEFLANLSRELKAPLTTIVEDAEDLANTLYDNPSPAQSVSCLREIQSSGRFLMELIDTLLDLSRLQTQELEPKNAACELPNIVTNCVALIAERAERNGVVVQVEPQAALPMLRADAGMTARMLVQLLSNAVKFTPPGGTVALRYATDQDGALRIIVSDTGIGIAPEHLGKVVQPFYRVENATRRPYQGAGLGLALVHAMIQAHGGTLTLESRFGIGTTATLRFPPNRTVAVPQTEVAGRSAAA